MHSDPTTGKPRRPGKYQEPNPEDPKYKQELEVWFNDSCVWLALLSASEDFGVNSENLDSRFEEIGEEIPGPALLKVAIEAARVNEGLNLADQLTAQMRQQEIYMEELRRLEEFDQQAEALAAAADNESPGGTD